MDRATLQQHFEQAERHVSQGEQHIARQQQLIAELERDGHPTEEAEALLTQFLETQALHVEHRDRLRRELARGG